MVEHVDGAGEMGDTSLERELYAARSRIRELEAQHVEDGEFIDSLGQICCAVAFTSGQYEEYNARVAREAYCAYCGETGPRTPEAMRSHSARCDKHPYGALVKAARHVLSISWNLDEKTNGGNALRHLREALAFPLPLPAPAPEGE